ncbi:MAG TPA: serine acetyltransferase [Solirubrobacteraceae bacterium]|nr:serine acetyltransferase [Solirubrobacteraceae bacterium]
MSGERALDVVIPIYAAWERGDYSSTDWADPGIECLQVDGSARRRWTGRDGIAQANEQLLGATDHVSLLATDYCELGDQQVLIRFVRRGRRKSGGGLSPVEGAHLFQFQDDSVTRLVAYSSSARALADLGIAPKALTAIPARRPPSGRSRALRTPLLVAYLLTDRRQLIDADVRQWVQIKRYNVSGPAAVLACCSERTHEFRTLFYHRLRHGNLAGRVAARLLRSIYPGEQTLFLECDDIGPGLFIQHGFATIIAAKRVGANVWVNQQVTIGFSVVRPPLTGKVGAPVIEDGAMIFSGAQVIGDVRVGRNAIVGAGAVVTRDVPADMVAVGVPATCRPARRHDLVGALDRFAR